MTGLEHVPKPRSDQDSRGPGLSKSSVYSPKGPSWFRLFRVLVPTAVGQQAFCVGFTYWYRQPTGTECFILDTILVPYMLLHSIRTTFQSRFCSFFYSFNRPKNETERELESRHSGSRLVFNHYAFLNKQDPFLVYLNSACTWADQKKDQKKYLARYTT